MNNFAELNHLKPRTLKEFTGIKCKLSNRQRLMLKEKRKISLKNPYDMFFARFHFLIYTFIDIKNAVLIGLPP